MIVRIDGCQGADIISQLFLKETTKLDFRFYYSSLYITITFLFMDDIFTLTADIIVSIYLGFKKLFQFWSLNIQI